MTRHIFLVQRLTCDWRFDFDHRLLVPQQHGALVDDPQRGRFVDPEEKDQSHFKNKVILKASLSY